MSAEASSFPQFGNKWNFATLSKLSGLSSPVQKHLQKVYLALAGALLLAAVGVYVDFLFSVGGILTSLSFVGSSIWLTSTPATPKEEGKRLKILGLAAFCKGLSIGPLVGLALDVDPGVLVTALLGTCAVFVCFSGAAIFAKRREFLFLGGILASATSSLLVLMLGSMLFGGAVAAFHVEIYAGLLIFLGYLLFDTQVIIEKANLGDFDYIRHTLDLFVDFVAIFVRLLIIMMKHAASKEARKREKRGRD